MHQLLPNAYLLLVPWVLNQRETHMWEIWTKLWVRLSWTQEQLINSSSASQCVAEAWCSHPVIIKINYKPTYKFLFDKLSDSENLFLSKSASALKVMICQCHSQNFIKSIREQHQINILFKNTLLLYSLYNTQKPYSEWLSLNFNENFNEREKTFIAFTLNKSNYSGMPKSEQPKSEKCQNPNRRSFKQI